MKFISESPEHSYATNYTEQPLEFFWVFQNPNRMEIGRIYNSSNPSEQLDLLSSDLE